MHAAGENILGTYTPGFMASSSPIYHQETIRHFEQRHFKLSLIHTDRKDNFVNFNLEPLHRQLASSVIINNPSPFQIYRTPFLKV